MVPSLPLHVPLTVGLAVGTIMVLLWTARSLRRCAPQSRRWSSNARRSRSIVRTGSVLSILLLLGSSLPALVPFVFGASIVVALFGLGMWSGTLSCGTVRRVVATPLVVVLGVMLSLAAGSLMLAGSAVSLPTALASNGSTTVLSSSGTPMPGMASSSGSSSQQPSSGISPAVTQANLAAFNTFTVTGNYVAAGIGMRNRGYGTITLGSIPSGSQVQAAYLYWDILDQSSSHTFAQGQVNGQAISGTLIGTDGSPCWPTQSGSGYSNYAYRADVTSLVSGNGDYVLTGFASGATDGRDPFTQGSPDPMLEGASLVVIYSNASSPSTQIVLYDGSALAEQDTLSLTLSGFTAPSPLGTAMTTFIVADGQRSQTSGDSSSFNNLGLPTHFDGTDPQAGPDYSAGNLWDTQSADVTSNVNPGSTSATVTVTSGDPSGADCLVWEAQIFAVSTPTSGLPVMASYSTLHQCAACAAHTAAVGGPINVVKGNSWLQQTDFVLPGIGQSLNLVRTYNSIDPTDTGFGVGWSWSYGLTISQPDSSTRLVRYADGRRDLYTSDGNGGFTPPAGTHNALVENGDGSYTLTTPQQLVYAFDSSGRLTSQTDRNGNAVILAYSSSGVTITAPGGRSVTLSYGTGSDASHFVTMTENDSLNRTVSYAYDLWGNLTYVVDVGSGGTVYSYDGLHHLLSRIDPRNHVLETNEYDSQGRVRQQTNANGGVITFSYDPANQETTVTDARNHSWIYAYNSDLLITSVTDPNNHTTSYGYDSDHNRISVTDANQHTTIYTYDGQGNVLTVTDPNQHTTAYTYNSFSEPLTKVDALNQETIYGYDNRGNLTSLTDPLNKIATATYDPSNGELLSVTDPLNHTTTYGYNASGDLTSITDALNHATSQTFDDGGRRLTQTDALSHTTTYGYDVFNHVISVTDPLNHETDYTYDADGNQLTRTDANQHTTTYSYDPMNQLISITDANNHTTSFSYDANGNQTGITDATSRTTTYGFDNANQLISVADNAGNSTSYTLDPVGRVTVVTDADQHATTYGYDDAGNLTTVTDALNGVTSYAYNAVNQVTSVTDANNHATTYGYDADGRPTGKTDALNHSWSVTYDDAGNLASATDANNHTTSYTQDAANRLTNISYFDGTSIAFGYDDANRETSRIDGTGTTTFSYDDAGNLTSVTAPGTGTVSYGYDPANQETSLTYPSNHTVSYGYDPAGRLTSTTDWLNQILTYGYDNAGRLASITDPNGVSAAYSYDPAGRLSEIVDASGSTTLMNLSYTRDGVGNVTQLTGSTVAGHGSGISAWGDNIAGELGDGTTTNQSTPEWISTITDMTTITGNGGNSLGLKNDGTVWAWGSNADGQLGDGTTTNRTSPVQVSGLSNVIAIGTGSMASQSLAVTSDGTAWAWGDNFYGQLGDGTTTNRTTPVAVSGLTSVVQVAAGYDSSMALKSDGTVWTWGENANGELGDGTTRQRLTPVQVKTGKGQNYLTGITAIGAGDQYDVALKSDGSVWIWGAIPGGNLNYSSYAVQVSGLSNIVSLAVGGDHVLALKSDGTVWAWGYNYDGQLGDGTTTNQPTPVQVENLDNITAIAAGAYFSLALKSDGTVWAWGDNEYGQLGDGSTTNRSAPVQAVGASDITGISAGWDHSLALQAVHPPSTSISYTYDELNRLTGASSSDGSSDTRVYDAVGNQTSVTSDGVQSTGSYNAVNELTAFGSTSYSYDNNGNRLTATTGGVTTTYGYDARNELTSIAGPLTASYTYNGAGERVSKTVDGVTTNYTWDPTGLGKVIADGMVENVFGPAGLAEQVTNSSQTAQFASADALGTIRLITDGSGNVVGSGSYSAWGMPDTGTITLGGFGFAGEQVDPETGFVYLRNRYYDPVTGRFLTPDPLGSLGSGVNLYAYVGNNPATLTDPSGLDGEDPEGANNDALWSGLLEGISYPHAPPELIPYTWEAGLPTEAEATAAATEGPIYGPFLPGEPPAGAGAFGPVGEGGMYCPETEGNGNGGQEYPPIQGGSEGTDWAKLAGMLQEAAAGKGNFGIGSATAEQADALGRAWVGPDYTVASDGKTLVSADGLRQYRPPTYKPNLGTTQANLEWRPEGVRQWQGNAHIDIVP